MAQVARIHGRLSQHTSGDEVFDIETEALFGTRPEVRTFVFRGGQIVGKLVWPLTRGNTMEGTRLVNIQHERVLRELRRGKDVESMGIPENHAQGERSGADANAVLVEKEPTGPSIDLGFEWSDTVIVDEVVAGIPTQESSGIEIVPSVPPKSSAPQAFDDVADVRDVEPSNEVAGEPSPDTVAKSATSTQPPTTSNTEDEHSLTGRLLRSGVMQRAAVIDDEGTLLAEMGDGAELLELAFLATGLESLLSETLSLGAYESTTIERQDQTVLVLHEGALICAFIPKGRLPRTKLVDAARQALRGEAVQ